MLNGLQIEMPENRVVDGIDLAPTLRGGKVERTATFTYFPTSPPVPDWLPPSVAVHSGE